jgi:hypothetical protein
MQQEHPKWLRDDGTDERLVNPIADLVRNFRHYEDDPFPPRQEKALFIEQSYPEFVESLLSIAGQIDDLDVIGRITSNNQPTEEEIKRHTELVRLQLEQTQQFVLNKYGSVKIFMDWWRR